MRFITALSLAVVVVASAVTPAGAQAPAASAFVEGQLLVKFRPGADAAGRADAHRQGGGTVLASLGRSGIELVGVGQGDERAAAERYRRNPNVQSAEPNYIRSIPEPTAHNAGSGVVPGDSGFREQWGLHNTGQTFQCLLIIGDLELCFYIGTPDADIDAPEAWAITTGQSNVRVAVIDSGVDYTHPDIAPNWIGGWDFVENDADPMDGHGHGTHVTGIIAGAIENMTGTPPTPEGIAGAAPGTGILGYRVCDASGRCTDAAIVGAIAQAVIDGASVINMSLGSTTYSQVLDDALQDAWAANVVIVAAAGNNGNTTPFYPANNANTVSVGAFDEDHLRAPFSNYGNWVDISAPGNAIYSSYPLVACGGLGPVPGDMGCYTWLSGTSMASPHVAAAVALLRARHPSMTNQQIVTLLLGTANPSGVSNVRLDSWTKHGGLNLHDALSFGSSNLAPTANAGPDQVVTDSDGDGSALVTLDGSASSDADGTITSYAWREPGGPIRSFDVAPSLWFPVGVTTMILDVTDDDGATSSDSVLVTVQPINTAPTAAGASVVTDVGVPVVVSLQGTDAETCELGFSIVQPPADGTLGAIQPQACVPGSPNTDTAQVVYTPASSGIYTLTFMVSDGVLSSAAATVAVTVNAPPPPPPAPPPNPISVTALNPGVVSQGAGVVVFVVSGTGFVDGATVAFTNGSGSAPRVLGVVWNSSTQLTATVEIRSGGPRRNRVWDVQVGNPNGSSATGAALLTITP